jgi:CelD/BcsL family acetyltransferase involved in cellulose biosynthesis
VTSTDRLERLAFRVVEVSGGLGRYAAAWDALAEQSPLPSPFLKTWWIDGVGGPDDLFVLVLEGEVLLGGLALQRRRRWGVEVLTVQGGGKLCPDHLDLVAQPDRIADVTSALRRWWRAGPTRVLDLDGLREDAHVCLGVVPEARLEVVDVAPYEELVGCPDDYLARRSSSFAKSHRKYGRRLDRAGVTMRRLLPAEVPAAMATFAALHGARDDRVELSREMPRVLAAVERGVAAGEVRVHVAECAGRTGAVLVTFEAGGRLMVYQTARAVDDRAFNHVGAVLDVVVIREAIAEGLTEIDFLRGDEPYKRSFVSQERRLLRARAARGARGRTLLAADLARGRLRRLAGRVVRRLRRSAPAG